VLNKKLAVRDLKMKLKRRALNPEMPVAQNHGIHPTPRNWSASSRSGSVKDYEDYIAPAALGAVRQTVVQMRKGMAEGLMPPRFLLGGWPANGIGTQQAEKSPFAHPFDAFPKTIPEADQKRLREQDWPRYGVGLARLPRSRSS
jgi:uncharacterized protein (DUF885 family)